MFRQVALTYSKGAAVIRQLAALIGDEALRAGLADFMRRFGGGSADLDDLIATTTLSLVLPAGWDCLTNGPVIARPPAGQAGTWRFGPVSGTRPFDLTIAAGPYVKPGAERAARRARCG